MGKQRKHRDTVVEGTATVIEKEEDEMTENTQDQPTEKTKGTQAQETPETNAPEPKKRGLFGKVWDATAGRAKRAWDNAPTPAKVFIGGLTAAAALGVVYWVTGGGIGSDSDDPVIEPPMLEGGDSDSEPDDVVDVPFQTVEEPVEE